MKKEIQAKQHAKEMAQLAAEQARKIELSLAKEAAAAKARAHDLKLKREKREEEYQKKEAKLKAKKEERETKVVQKYLTKEQKAKEKEELKQMILEEKRAEAKEKEIRQSIEKHREAQRLEEAAKKDLLLAMKNAAIARNEKLKADEAAARYEGHTISSSEKKNTKNKKGARSLHIRNNASDVSEDSELGASEVSIDDTLDADDEVVRLRKQVSLLQKEMSEVEGQLKAKQLSIYENKHHDNRTDDDTTYGSDQTRSTMFTKDDDKEERDQAPVNQGLFGPFGEVADGVVTKGYDVLTWFLGDPESCGSVLESCGTSRCGTTSTYEPKSVNSLDSEFIVQ